jgi:CrcB protein
MVASAVRAPMPTLSSIAAVGIGAAVGAWLRWGLSFALNPVFPTIPLGTLAANLVGGLMMGVAMELITRHTLLSPEARLLVTTGFLGGLTTFSTFSAEVTTLIVRREWIWGLLTIGLHVVGSVALTMVGLLAARALFTWGQP